MAAIAERIEQERRAYAHGEDRPIGSYGALMTVYATGVVALSALVRKRRALPDRVGLGDLALISIASHKLSRLIAKDTVTAAVRAPFTRFSEAAGEGEVNEEVRGTGIRHAVGELVTCPFCLSMWVATAFAFGIALAPRATRLAAAALTAVTASDYLQFAHSALQRAEREK
jgi:hypothetical protein